MGFKMNAGWGNLQKAWDGRRYQKRIRASMRKATMLVGKVAEKEMRQTIKDGGMAANADLTVAVKGSTKPLVDKGNLFKAITSQYQRDYSVFVGVLQASGSYDIAMTLHEGASIRVTPKMRGLFYVLWLASQGDIPPSELEGRAAELWARKPSGWHPLKDTTSVIVIPGRPFVKMTFAKPGLNAKAQAIWAAALAKAQKAGV